MSVSPGSTLGPYELIEEIGSGGMATVYKAYHARLDRYVAIKLMHTNFHTDATFRTRFEREAKIVARLEHPHIVPVYDFSEYEQPYLVMKFIDGEMLKDRLQRGPMPTGEVTRVMDAIADALTYAHEQGILHRDIKPSNIIFDARDQPYLTDFGLARLAAAGESTMSADVMLGTPHYISPEQAKGLTDLDARTDVYSLGVVLYELVVGRVPFSGDTPYAIIHDHIYTPLPDPRSQNPNVSDAVASVLEKALAKSPSGRYETPRALMDAFKQAVATHHTDDQPPVQVAPSPPVPAVPPIPEMPKPGSNPAFDIQRSIQEAHRDNAIAAGDMVNPKRTNWRPGTEWTRDINGLFGFYAPEEINAQINALPPEQALRVRAERKIKARDEMRMVFGIFTVVEIMLLVIYFLTSFPGHPWPIWPLLGFTIATYFIWDDYRNKYGAGRDQRENAVQHEIERERARLSDMASSVTSHKSKNDEQRPNLTSDPRDMNARQVRLTGDGELTDSFIDQINDSDHDDSLRRAP